eukprot:1155180-Pelagomonas_calceolata.AAC.2
MMEQTKHMVTASTSVLSKQASKQASARTQHTHTHTRTPYSNALVTPLPIPSVQLVSLVDRAVAKYEVKRIDPGPYSHIHVYSFVHLHIRIGRAVAKYEVKRIDPGLWPSMTSSALAQVLINTVLKLSSPNSNKCRYCCVLEASIPICSVIRVESDVISCTLSGRGSLFHIWARATFGKE